MNELGSLEKKSHEDIGAFARGRCDYAVFVGPNAEIMQKGYGDKSNSIVFKNRTELLNKIDNIIEKGDLILVKASQNGNYFEEVTKYLMKDPEKADKLLVRQSKFWLRKKRI
jgi:UDP-N-acetylmuramyl pentapeptide synthase